ncbi:hypothetical protein JCM14467A_09230 [Vulcanisaeta sp. JCM 14467]
MLATVGNVIDLVISCVGVVFLGLYEGNAFATQLHLSDYLAIALAIITYQVIVTTLYLLYRWVLKRWGTVKSLGVIAIKYFLISFMIGLTVLKYLFVAYDMALILSRLVVMSLYVMM